MGWKVGILATLPLLAPGPWGAGDPGGSAGSRAFGAERLPVEIPLRWENGWFVVPVVAGGVDSLTFIVDTGASVSAVTESTAARLKLAPGTPVTASGASGEQRLRVTRVPRLTFGGVDAHQARVLVLADETLAPERAAELGLEPFDGVLGSDQLAAFDVLLDPVAGALWLYEPGEAPGREVSDRLSEPLPMTRLPGGLLMHDIEVRGVVLPAVLDTGARYVVLSRLAAERAGVEASAGTGSRMGVGSETTQVGEGHTDALRIGKTPMSATSVRIGDLPVFRALGLSDAPAVLLGNPVLRRCPVLLSYRENTVRYCREVGSPG